MLAQQARCQPALRTERCGGREGTEQHLPNIALPSEQCGPAERSILQLNIERVGYIGHTGHTGCGSGAGQGLHWWRDEHGVATPNPDAGEGAQQAAGMVVTKAS